LKKGFIGFATTEGYGLIPWFDLVELGLDISIARLLSKGGSYRLRVGLALSKVEREILCEESEILLGKQQRELLDFRIRNRIISDLNQCGYTLRVDDRSNNMWIVSLDWERSQFDLQDETYGFKIVNDDDSKVRGYAYANPKLKPDKLKSRLIISMKGVELPFRPSLVWEEVEKFTKYKKWSVFGVKDHVKAREKARPRNYDSVIAKGDIINMFPSVNVKYLRRIVEESRSPILERALSVLLGAEFWYRNQSFGVSKGLIIGHPYSPIFAELCVRSCENSLQGSENVLIVRYVDDFVISGFRRRQVEAFQVEYTEKMRLGGFEIEWDDLSESASFLDVEYYPGMKGSKGMRFAGRESKLCLVGLPASIVSSTIRQELKRRMSAHFGRGSNLNDVNKCLESFQSEVGTGIVERLIPRVLPWLKDWTFGIRPVSDEKRVILTLEYAGYYSGRLGKKMLNLILEEVGRQSEGKIVIHWAYTGWRKLKDLFVRNKRYEKRLGTDDASWLKLKSGSFC
jgi:hypothetical protein